MSKKHKKVCTSLNYIEHFLILASTVTGVNLQLLVQAICAFASLLGIPIRITSSTIKVNICAISAGIKKNKSINKKKREVK